ncbi:hypothetical protein NIA71_08315 [Ihubacter massiliensis]|uniref:hypothetical protein n=1 Tax=Ihubacter massiliensis TaxID=1852367 RepID=UPI002096E59A|nr:hypothetical protein [Ihubacter massiliensis]MCO7121953.1 hypothetical protein [Ihubacter massiliensis]
MAVIKEYKNEHGATIKINDAAYRDKSPEELKKIAEHANAVAWQILKNSVEEKAI